MGTREKVVETEQVTCEMCLKEIPKEASTSAEATDYFVYFCGLDCYAKWKQQEGTAAGVGKSTAPGS